MITAIRKRMEAREEGFTLIELLVVVIIVGILAAIAIPTFLRQRERGWEADAQSNLRNAAIAQQSYFTEQNTYAAGADVAASVALLTAEGFVKSALVSFNEIVADADSYCMIAQHNTAGDAFKLDSTTGSAARVARGDTSC